MLVCETKIGEMVVCETKIGEMEVCESKIGEMKIGKVNSDMKRESVKWKSAKIGETKIGKSVRSLVLHTYIYYLLVVVLLG